MNITGSDSWTLGVAVDAVPLALYVRDALRLDTSADELSPPPLIDLPPDRRGLLVPGELEQAGHEWAAWWRTVVHHDGLFHATRVAGDFLAWYRSFALERAAAVGEPPEFAGLAGSPALQHAAVGLFPDARTRSRREDVADGVVVGVAAEIAGEVAEDVAARHGVGLGSMRGMVLVHATKGLWWRVAEPGVLVCSIGCMQSDEYAAAAVREVFESSLQ